MEEKRSFKEQRIREILFMYYSKPDVRRAMFEFSSNRECVPSYMMESFGKRPDAFQYDSDISEYVKKGATSFHCSEEIWQDPLEISTELSPEEFNELRIGWDLLLDIDSPYLEYSKIYASLLIKALKFNGLQNIGVKFSGSKGFHVVVPWKAFPKEVYGQKTSDMFPEWPKIICQYLASLIQPQLTEKILADEGLKQIAKKTGKKEEDLSVRECKLCDRQVTVKELVTWICPNCKNELEMIRKTKRIPKCPDDFCRKPMEEIETKEIYACEFCNINSYKNPENFESKERFATEKLIEADLVLVSSRHLFRMPYSLHEKTALSSIVIDKDKISEFQITDAKPLNVEIKNFYPNPMPNEAKELLLQALDWNEEQEKIKQKTKEIKKQLNKDQEQNFSQNPKNKNNANKEFKKIEIQNPSEKIYPPCIKKIMQGVKDDGRKRALFVLINFFKSLGIKETELETKLEEWNKKNYKPLKQGYIISQLNWYRKSGSRMPPNCDKTNYKDLNACLPDALCREIKNPVNYAVKKYFKRSQ